VSEPPARLIVHPPLPEGLAQGIVVIRYATENLQVVPVFGQAALAVSPRIGHLHVTVDDLSWHFVVASGDAIALVPMPPGPHQVLVELADPTHQVITGQMIEFTMPDLMANAP
jgi:hypothetical protein